MCIEIQQKNQFLVVTIVENRLDAALAPQFRDRMKELIEVGHHSIILNLDRVNFIDSSGLGVIVSSLKMLGGQGDLILCGAQGTVASLFKLTRMDKVFPMYSTLEQATQVTSSH
jgi:anti-sigma B factor antagonist